MNFHSHAASNADDICCIENKKQRSQDGTLWNATVQSTNRRPFTAKHHCLCSACKKRPYPVKNNPSNAKWWSQTVKKNLVVDSIKCRTEIQKSNKGNFPGVSGIKDVGHHLQKAAFSWVTRSVCRLQNRHQLTSLQMISDLPANQSLDHLGYECQIRDWPIILWFVWMYVWMCIHYLIIIGSMCTRMCRWGMWGCIIMYRWGSIRTICKGAMCEYAKICEESMFTYTYVRMCEDVQNVYSILGCEDA